MAARVLLDTHTLVWALSSPDRLSARAVEIIRESDVAVSVASLWELLLKKDKPGSLLGNPVPWWEEFVRRQGIRVIGIRQSHILQLGELPDHHRDPFDRVLIAQAIVERASLVSKDSALLAYDVPVIW